MSRFFRIARSLFRRMFGVFSPEVWRIDFILKQKLRDHCVMVLPPSLGDMLFVASNLERIEKETGVKIFPVIRKDREVVVELCSCSGCFAVPDLNVIPSLLCIRILYGCVLGRQVIRKLIPDLRENNLLFAHPDYYTRFRKIALEKTDAIPEMYRSFFKMDAPMSFPSRMERIENPGLSVPPHSVMLCPQAASADELPEVFWRELSSRLALSGWKVFYNSSHPVAYLGDAVWLDCSLRDAVVFGQKADFVISIRSGFCDLMADKGGGLIVIYPDVLWRGGRTFFEVFDIQRYFRRTDIGSCIFRGTQETVSYVLEHIARTDPTGLKRQNGGE